MFGKLFTEITQIGEFSTELLPKFAIDGESLLYVSMRILACRKIFFLFFQIQFCAKNLFEFDIEI